jgi:hypothetical protein
LAVAIEQAAHLPSSAVNSALTGIPAGGQITEAELAGAFSRAGLRATGAPESETLLTRAAAADWIFADLKDR